jgi:thiamine pyrophosphokinase
MLMGTFVVVVGGGSLPCRTRMECERLAAVVAVDSGLDVALAAGLTPTLLVGDLDSISAAGLDWASRHSIPTEPHPADKDATDTALALSATAALAADDPGAVLHVLCGTASDRLDHLLGVVSALGAPGLAAFAEIRANLSTTSVRVVHPGHAVVLDLPAGAVFSLLALHGRCDGVAVTEARWPLHDSVLEPSATVGISNESLGRPVAVSSARGVLTVVVPGPTS